MSRTIRHSVVSTCSPEHAFEVYIDWQRWRHRSVFGEMGWAAGDPWTIGSRMEIELTYPQPTRVQEVVVAFRANQPVGLISHALGVTIEHNVYFEPLDGGSKITVQIQIAGPVAFVAGFAVQPIIESITLKQFEDLKTECDRSWQQLADAKAKGLKPGAPRGGNAL